MKMSKEVPQTAAEQKTPVARSQCSRLDSPDFDKEAKSEKMKLY